MPINQMRNLLVISVPAVCLLAVVLWAAGVTSHAALPRSNENGTAGALSHVAPGDAEVARLRANEAYGKLPLSFEANMGQTDAQVKYLSRGSGYSLFLTADEAVLSLQQDRTVSANDDGTQQRRSANDVLRVKLLGASRSARVTGSDELPGKSNYFIGNNPRKWRTNVATFARVQYRDVYPGVDLVYYGQQRQLENDFVIAPGANPDVIALAFAGASSIAVAADGSLVLNLKSSRGFVRLQRPVTYQLLDGERHEVACKYVMRDASEVGFAVAAYDPTRPLVIDPVLVYSSYLGGNGADSSNGITVDDAGNAYVVGDTGSAIFPTVNPIDSTRGGTQDAFVVKINAAGSAVVYSTYLGGSNTETAVDVSVDTGGNAYVTGRTTSNDFPTVNAFDSTYSGGTDEDAFVTRINAAGSALVYSTYLSGNFGARAWGIAANNSQGFAYVTGTTSTGFPVTAGAFEATNFNSGFLTKLCTNCSGAASLVYSTFLAHTGSVEGRSVAADVAGNAYITGNLNSTATNFASVGAFQTTYGGGSQDAYVEKFNTNLAGAVSRVYATYLGGSGKDIGASDGASNPGRAIAIDDSGNVYVTGATGSANFPLANASQGAIGGLNDAFLSKLNANGSALIYSTYLGGTGDDLGRSVAVNLAGGAYVTGLAGPNFPTVNSLPTPNAGIGFVTKFTPSGSVLYSTILSGVSGGSSSIALDLAGNAFATGNTNASIVTVFPFQPVNGGGGTDGWVSMIADPTIIGRVSDENGNPMAGATVNLAGTPSATTTTDANGAYTFGLLTAGNSYTVSVLAPNYVFNSAAVNNLQKNARRDFGPVVVSISGQVTLGSGGLSQATIALNLGAQLLTQTDANGFYSFNNVPAGRSYIVAPRAFAYTFEPPIRSAFVVDNQTFNFVATAVPIISFSAFSYAAAEGGPATTITVTRGHDTSGVSVVSLGTVPVPPLIPCSTNDGNARYQCDYTLGSSKLTFNPGETSKSFTLFINDDAYVEGDETVDVRLFIESGGGATDLSTTHVTITDNDTVTPTTNPLDNADEHFFVNTHYVDFLNRLPDQGGFDFWVGQITQCGADQTCINSKRLDVSNAFFYELEYQQTAAYVFRLYRTSFGNNQPSPNPDNSNPVEANKIPSFAAFSLDRASLVGSTNLAQDQLALANLFVARPEFLNKYPGSLTLDQFVDAVLLTIKNDEGADLTSQRAALISLGSRAAVMYRVSDDNQANPINNRAFIDAAYNRSFVASQYFGYLRRDADIGGFLFWLGQVNGAPLRDVSRQHAMVCSFVTSSEYQLRFSSIVTHSNTECPH
jgi:Carboxypeptidase regulatory-like domain/Calx-beta domain/Beta-propeller repeat